MGRVEAEAYVLPGGGTVEVHKPFGNEYYYAFVKLSGQYPQAGQIARDIGRREYVQLLEGKVTLTVNGEDNSLESGATQLIKDGDAYRLSGDGELMVFVEDQEGGTTQIEDLQS
jgi:hypothetical protein